MFTMPLYEVRYRDEKEWEEISELELMNELYKVYEKIIPVIKEMIRGKEVVIPVIKEMIKGVEIITPEAIYRLKSQGANNRKSLYLN